MPKTAGLSFRASLEEHFGAEFHADYGDYPLAHSPQSRQESALRHSEQGLASDFEAVKCIHGHFLPLKYQFLSGNRPCKYITWLRDPVTRLVSHYDYWLAAYDAEAASTSSLHRRVVEEDWSLEAFCMAPELRNIYTDFLWGFAPERLDFVGITEHFAEDLRYFSTVFLGNNLQPRYINQRDSRAPDETPSSLSLEFVRQVREYHSADVALYAWALALRDARGGLEEQLRN